MKTTRAVQKSKVDALNVEEIEAVKRILPTLGNEKKFLFNCLMYGGYRIGELIHQRKSWIHINDSYSEGMGMDYIQIPLKGEFCSCRDCKIQAFLDEEAQKPNVTYSAAWQKKIMESFDIDTVKGRYWQPKTLDSSRKIPIVYDEFRKDLHDFYFVYTNFDYTRQKAWRMVKDISMAVWGSIEVPSESKLGVYRIPVRDLYPHALRATAASLWASRGINANALKAVMGWSSIEIADHYVRSDEKQALITCRNLAGLEVKS